VNDPATNPIPPADTDRATILKKAKQLAPWHFDFELFDGFRTASCNDATMCDPNKRNVAVVDPWEIKNFYSKYYPNGLANKEILDVACNSGGYCFVSGILGARRVRGFDIRRHWIDQANFVHSVLFPQLGNVCFELADAKEVSKLGSADIVLFKGILYHLPDPIHTLLEVCSVAREIIFINTETDNRVPEHCLSA
jgi:tRNA (mo5U34)-methyltransferase